MYWKTPPEIPGHIGENQCKIARAVFASCDMNENHGKIEGLDPKEIPPEQYVLKDRTYLFHRSENLGDILSHVYLHDEGQMPVSIQANEMLEEIYTSTDRTDDEKRRAVLQVTEAHADYAKERMLALPLLRAELQSEIEKLKPVKAEAGIGEKILSLMGLGK